MPDHITPENTVIDAARRFEIRQKLSRVFNAGTNEQAIIRATLDEQPQLFCQYIAQCNFELGQTLVHDLQDGIETEGQIVLRKGDLRYSRDFDYQVIEDEEADSLPRLVVRSTAIQEAYRLLDPIYVSAEPEERGRQEMLKAAVIVPAWMGLGKWAFGKFDPRESRRFVDNENARTVLSSIALIGEPEGSREEDTSIDHEQVNEKLNFYRYRLMGALAFAGLEIQIGKYEKGHGLPNVPTLDLFKQLYTRSYCDKVARIKGTRRIDDRTSAMEYALANPITPADIKRTIELLTGK